MVKSACGIEAVYMCFNGTGIWGGETIKPYLEYCCSIWGNCSKENINIIVKLQKKAARLILDVTGQALIYLKN